MVQTLHSPPGPRGHLLEENLREYARDTLSFLASCARRDGARLRSMGQTVYLLSRPDLIAQVPIQRYRPQLTPGRNVGPYPSATLGPKSGIRMVLAERSARS